MIKDVSYFTVSGRSNDFIPFVREFLRIVHVPLLELNIAASTDEKDSYSKIYGIHRSWKDSCRGVLPEFVMSSRKPKAVIVYTNNIKDNLDSAFCEMTHGLCDDPYASSKIRLSSYPLLLIFTDDYGITESDDISVRKKKLMDSGISDALSGMLITKDIIVSEHESFYSMYCRFMRQMDGCRDATISEEAKKIMFLSSLGLNNDYSFDPEFVSKDKSKFGLLNPSAECRFISYMARENLPVFPVRTLFVGDVSSIPMDGNHFYLDGGITERDIVKTDPDAVFLVTDAITEESLQKIDSDLGVIRKYSLVMPVFLVSKTNADLYSLVGILEKHHITGFSIDSSYEEFIRKTEKNLSVLRSADLLHHSSERLIMDKSFIYKNQVLIVSCSTKRDKVKSDMEKSAIKEDFYTGCSFDSWYGPEELKKNLMGLKSIFADYRKNKREGKSVSLNNIMLYGPAGTGKTLLTQCFASDLFHTFSMDMSELASMDSQRAVGILKEIFRSARETSEYGPVLIVMDECDLVGKKRTDKDSESSSLFLNAFLQEVNGFADTTAGRNPVILMATTNRDPAYFDPAFLRRLPVQILVDLPDEGVRKAIFLHYAEEYGIILNDKDASLLASHTKDKSPSYIKSLCELAKVYGRSVTEEFLQEEYGDAVDVTDEKKRLVCLHEAGHALASDKVPDEIRLLFRENILGVTSFSSDELNTPSGFRKMIIRSMGGAAAEKIVNGYYTGGCDKDLKKAGILCREYCKIYGYNNAYFTDPDSNFDFTKASDHLFAECMEEATRILKRKKYELKKLADLLYEKGVLYKNDIMKFAELDVESELVC